MQADFKKLYIQEQKVNKLLLAFNQAENINEIFLKLKDQLADIFECERITIFAIDKKTRQLYSRLKSGNEHREIRLFINRKSIAGYVAATRKIVNLKDAYVEEERLKNTRVLVLMPAGMSVQALGPVLYWLALLF